MELRLADLEFKRDACVQALESCDDEDACRRILRRIGDLADQIEVLHLARMRRDTAPYPVVRERFIHA
jgi:hypothetical protein